MSVSRTHPPGKYVVLFDGQCQFCQAQVRNLLALARPGTLDAQSFQEPGVLDRFPGITHAACMEAMHLVTPDGRVYKGFEAVVQAIATRPILGKAAYVYYLPGLRWLCDRLYALIAANRYRLMGKRVAAGECADGTCALHLQGQARGARKAEEP
jgi:predicted DCC family thiol-disulfide oxidoreductase YuxK